jgi:hypothetical protein
MWYIRKIPISMHLIRRKNKRKRSQSKQPILRRKKEQNHKVVLFADFKKEKGKRITGMFCLREHGALGESMPDRKFKQEKKSVNI